MGEIFTSLHAISAILKLLMVLRFLYVVSFEVSSFLPRVQKESTKRKKSKMASARYFQGFMGKMI